jgi:hypothetical protein
MCAFYGTVEKFGLFLEMPLRAPLKILPSRPKVAKASKAPKKAA